MGRSLTRRAGVLAVAMAVTACSPFGQTSLPDEEGSIAVPQGCVEVPAAISSEKVTLLQDLAEQFNGTSPEVDGQCVAVTVYRQASGRAASLLAEGWPDEAGPAPVLWSPASSAWGSVLNQRLEQSGRPPMANDFRRIMLTPLVLAMPRPMAEAMGWPETAIGWSDVLALAQDPEGWGRFGHPEWGQFRLGKTNPNFSTSGLSATIAIYYAATGKQSELTLDDVGSSSVADFVRGVEASTVHYGDTTLTFLENMLREDRAGRPLSYASAVAVEEVSVIAYNRGDPADQGLENPQPPSVPLVAVYPKEGTLYSDNPAYVLDAPWVDDVQRQAAIRFRDFVVEDPENQARALDFGFRPGNPSVAIGDPISTANGLNPSQPETELPVPSPAVLDALVRSWETYRKPANVLMVLDVSGSMGDLGGNGFSKLDLAKQAVLTSLEDFKDEDDVGLWVFSTELDGSRDYLELVSPGPMSQVRGEIESRVSTLIADGGTGLYDTTRAAVDAIRSSFDQSRINAVVLLTDGMCDDDPPGCDLGDLLAFLDQSEQEVVRVFAVAYGSDADVEALQAIADATRARLYRATDPSTIGQVFEQVVSNF